MAACKITIALVAFFAVTFSESAIFTENVCDEESLINFAKKASNWTLIRINCLNTSLTSPIIFTDHKSLVLDGQGARIICTSREAGFGFVNVQNLTLNNFSLVNCSMWNSAAQIGLSEFKRAALLIYKGSGVTISHVRVTNSTGTGLRILETTSNVEIKQSLFAHSATENGSTAGLHIELTDPSFKAFKCSYVIEGCTFVSTKSPFWKNAMIPKSYLKVNQGFFVVELEFF